VNIIMATAKKAVRKSPAKSKASFAKVELPKGFTAIASGSYGDIWEYEKHPVLVGKVIGDVRTITQKPDKKGAKPRETRVITVKSEADGKVYTVWESTALEEFFNHVRRGMRIAITFHGLRDVGRPQPMKVFQGAFTDEDAAEFVDDENDDNPLLNDKPAAKKRAPAKKRGRK
jgi:hypothetical protein